MGKQALDNAIRDEILSTLISFMNTHYDADTMPISTSKFVMPVVDAEGNEKFARITVEIPRGTRNGDGGYDDYDGYGLAEEWKLKLEDDENKRKVKEAEKERKEKEKERKRNARKVIKKLNQDGLEKMIHEEEEGV